MPLQHTIKIVISGLLSHLKPAIDVKKLQIETLSLGHDQLASAEMRLEAVPRVSTDVAAQNTSSTVSAMRDDSSVNEGFDIYEESLIVACKMNRFARGGGSAPLLDLIPGECCPLGSLNFICLGPACKFKYKGKCPSLLTNK